MKVTKTKLPGVLIIEPEIFGDQRGFFLETFHIKRYQGFGIPGEKLSFVQDNHSRSRKGVLRGLHFQKKYPQGKLVRVVRGKVFDVAVDICPKSVTFRQWVAVELSDENHRQLWIPPGYAHGYCTLSEIADFEYKCTDYYHPEDEGGIHWNDPYLAINWPIEKPIVSDKDGKLPRLAF